MRASLRAPALLALAGQPARVIAEPRQDRLDAGALRIESAVERRMDAHVQILHRGRGMIEASAQVSRKAWRIEVQPLQLQRTYPVICAMTYVPMARPLRRHDLDKALQNATSSPP